MLFARWRRSKQKTPETSLPETPNIEFVASIVTDVGCCREINEDCGRFVKPGDAGLLASKGVLTIVADGMGGHLAGEVASRTAIDVVSRVYYEDKGDAPAALKQAFLKANREIYEASLHDNDKKGMGTTCTALALQNGSAISAHVGDSRLYLVRNGKITLQTEDHSVVREMVKTGLISDEEARRHPDKNLILRAMGRHPDIEVAMWREPLAVREGDQFLLCSDGLSDLVSDEEMKEAVLLKPLHAACESLVALAKERGGHDNVTVGIVSVRLAGASENVDAPETREVKTAP